MSPRILRIITRLNVGGPATHVQLANSGLDARGWETLLVYGSVDPDEAEAPLREGIEHIKVPQLQRKVDPRADAAAWVAILRTMRTFRPHIIHTHLSKAGLLGRSAAMMGSSAPRVHTFHGNVFDGYFSPMVSRAVLSVERSLGRFTDGIVALSESQRSELQERRIGVPERIDVVPLGIDLERFARVDRQGARSRLELPADQPIVVAVGRMVPIKRLDRLIRAFVIVASSVVGAHLYLVGGGSERHSLEALVDKLGLTRNVTFVGWSTATPDWYGAADVVALSSEREGTPLALIEAAAASRAAVATSVGGVPDVVESGRTGILVANGDENGLAHGLIGLLKDPAIASSMGSAAHAEARRFGAERLVDDLDALYRQVLRRKRT